MAVLTKATPFLMCNDLQLEIAFFRDMLGFEVGFVSENPDYAFIFRDQAALRLLQTPTDLSDERRQQMVYIDVDDIDAL